MIFTGTKLAGAVVVDLEPRTDERGFFSRAFCQREFQAHGLKPVIAQCNISFNYRKGIVRGLHFQFPPAAETKFVRCTRGAIVDVIVDLRPESPTFLQHVAVELTADNRRGLFVPERFAHGYQVLEDNTETMYQCGEFYQPAEESGLLYADPALGIAWPVAVSEMSEKDRTWQPLRDVEALLRGRMAAGAPATAP